MRKPELFVVEDEEEQRNVLELMFEGEGYTVKGFPSAEDALRALEEHHPHLIITDVKLTGIDGFAFYDTIAEYPAKRRIPFIFITAYNDPRAIESMKKSGAAGYVTKPYNLEELLALVKRQLPPDSTSP